MSDSFTFGEHLRSFRKRAGLNQTHLADLLRSNYSVSASKTTIANWENSVYRPKTRDVVLAIAVELSLNSQETDLLLCAAEYAPQVILSSNVKHSIVSPTGTPPIPQLVIGRDKDLDSLRERLTPSHNNIALQVLTAVHGWPGVGKTTIAAALANDQYLRKQFPDGVLWASVGQSPKPLSILRSWGRTIGLESVSSAQSLEEARDLLAAFMYDRGYLFILDDIWHDADAKPFLLGGSQCATLVTTRMPSVARILAPTAENIYLLSILDEESSLKLLRCLAHEVVEQNETACRELIKALEGLPLALQVAGRLLHAEANTRLGVDVLLEELRDSSRILNAEAPAMVRDGVASPTVAALLKRSIVHLDQRTKQCFVCLGGLASKPATFQTEALAHIWKRNLGGVWGSRQVRDMVYTLVERGLLESVGKGRFWIHSLLQMLARTEI